MKFLPIFLVFVMCFAVRANSEEIQCYECADCGDLTDSLLQSCPKPTTDPPTTTEEISTGTPLDTTTEAPADTTTEAPAETTTEEPAATTIPPAEQQNPVVNPEVISLVKGMSKAISQNSPLSRSYRSIFRAGPSYLCYSVDKIETSGKKPQKGCVEVPEDKQACDVLKELYGEIENCQTCQESKCNGSAALKYSVVMMLVTMVLGVFFK